MSLLVSLSKSVGLALFAAACGIVASRALNVAANGLLALLSLVLAGALAVVWHIVAKTSWAAPAESWRDWSIGQPLSALPYAQNGSDAAHLSANLGQFRAWLGDVFAPLYLGIVLIGVAGAVVAVAVAAALAASSSPQIAALSILTLIVAQAAAVQCKGNGRPQPLLQGIVLVALMFAIGYGVFAPLTLAVMCIALAFGAVAASFDHNRPLQLAGYGLGLATMIVARQPLGAFVLAVMWLPQVLLPRSANSRAQAGWLLAGLVAASIALAL